MKNLHSLFQRIFTACLAVVLVGSVQIVAAQDDATAPISESDEPCADGSLRIRDFVLADASFAEGIERTGEAGAAWQKDARLYSLQVRCPLLESGFEWDGTYFSEQAQAFWRSGTNETNAADDDPDTIRTLVTDGISFQQLNRSLLRAGYSEDLIINVSTGVTIRYNTVENPFGPPNAPVDVVLFHVAIEERGEVKDVWVSVEDGTVFRYE